MYHYDGIVEVETCCCVVRQGLNMLEGASDLA